MITRVQGIQILFVFAVLFTSCESFKEEEKRINKPESMGRFAELSIIVPRSCSDSSFDASLRACFGFPVAGLPFDGEPAYKLFVTDETYLKGYFILHHQVVLLVPKDALQDYEKVLEPELFSAIRQASMSGKSGIRLRDVWSKPQYVQVIIAKDKNELEALLQNSSESLRSAVIEAERSTGSQRLFRTAPESDSFFTERIKDRSYAIRKKNSMRVAYMSKNFVWMREQNKRYDLGICMYHLPWNGEIPLSRDSAIAIRNRYVGAVIQGTLPQTPMLTALPEEVTLVHSEIDFNGKKAFETRGWWELKNDFMGGPFLMYSIYDEKRKRLIVLEGQVYAPNEPKIKQIRELEVILHTFVQN